MLLAEPDAATKLSLRDRMMLIFFYDTGAHIQEVLNVRICDLKLDFTPKVVLHGKGNKVRTVPLMKDTAQHLVPLLNEPATAGVDNLEGVLYTKICPLGKRNYIISIGNSP